ncbi:Hypothetical protein AA314_06299 [Archangium gephyra]|uniref:Uncharacterized protein n=1 Tax=Archangium gephyra TaxID=48 RepID=A0AAC8QCF6_9BACT|nr:Hypothetical protein AA314_06299 [Archangium gephyra]
MDTDVHPPAPGCPDPEMRAAVLEQACTEGELEALGPQWLLPSGMGMP